MATKVSPVGLVVIGRNEGDRLRLCLTSAVGQVAFAVYVDSGSTDDSTAIAQALGVEVVNLDIAIPFTAARARNAGFERLMQCRPSVEYVQFMDGDCELVDGWLEQATRVLGEQSSVAIVCGRRRERYPKQSIYNQLCDLEWDTPIGETKACGGDFLVRTQAFRQVDGFTSGLIAGEEPELCVRLRQHQWKIWRIDAEMTLHDAQMTTLSQWWKRFQRAGYAYAEGSWLHGKGPEKHWVKESRSIWLWGGILPLSILLLLIPSHGLSVVVVSLYLISIYKIYRYARGKGWSTQERLLYAVSCVCGKFPNFQGQLGFYWNLLTSQSGKLIEYK
jgi:glycosyltransferase involved in cell wall biosynthesis